MLGWLIEGNSRRWVSLQFTKAEPGDVPLKVEICRESSRVLRNREKNMPVLCFQKKDSNQPVCGVHNVALVQNRIAIDSNAPGLGRIACLICAVSRTVVQEGKMTYARNAF
jgi:hypothetical protein